MSDPLQSPQDLTNLGELTPERIQAITALIPTLPAADAEQFLVDLEAYEQELATNLARTDFLVFCKRVYPSEFKEGPHHRHMKPLLHNVCNGSELRLTVSMPPRFGKSETIAFLFVAWYLGHHPDHQIMMVTHTAALSTDFGRKVRNLIDSPTYKAIFPDTIVSRDKSAADDWGTTRGGKYLAVGIGGSVAGRGADLLIADDLVSEQAVLVGNADTAFSTAWNYMQVGPLQRLMPGGRIIMIGTRWGKKDPIGRALEWARNNTDSPQWNEVRFPAIMPSGKSLWPEQWPAEQLLAKKASMFPQFWAAQYMQEPTSEEGALLKRDWWNVWERDKAPAYETVIQTWDTAHETKTMSDYSACVTFGVWYNEESERYELILLNAVKGRWEFPELKKKALEEFREWEPEMLLVEKKAAGAPLIQELRTMGLMVHEISPSRGTRQVANDKYARVNSVSPILMDGVVWAPDMRWARELINECAEFPNGEHDDFVDCVVMALQMYRAGGYIGLSTDEKDDRINVPRRKRAYY